MILHGDRIAVVGDLHGNWNERDNEYFDQAGYDLLLFVGDLGSGTLKNERKVIREIGRLRVAGLVLPGNNDAAHLPELTAEFAHQSGRGTLMSLAGLGAQVQVEPCGYSAHVVTTSAGNFTIIAARPCAMGGSQFSFGEEIERTYQVSGIRHSLGRLKRLIDDASTEHLVFLAHNGPRGLGGGPEDPWARDFDLPEGQEGAPLDWGDRDLQGAVLYATQRQKKVLAVIAGHMHRSARFPSRRLVTEQGGIVYVNAAVVPRIRVSDSSEEHHHVEFVVKADPTSGKLMVEVREHWISTSLE